MGLVKLASAAARIASTLRLQPENDVPEAIRDGSLYTDILKEHWRQRLLDFDLVSFWEGGEKVSHRVKPSAISLVACPGIARISSDMNADSQQGECKFWHSRRQGSDH